MHMAWRASIDEELLTMPRKFLTPDDILSECQYAKVRDQRRAALRPLRAIRRVPVGPFAVFVFENWETMWFQVQEMLRVEKGGDQQLVDELEAYNPLIPDGSELVATLMLEIEDPVQRDAELRRLGKIENHVRLRIDDSVVVGDPESDQERTDDEGRASAVHFFHFRLSQKQIAAFRGTDTKVSLEIAHPNYDYSAVVSSQVRFELEKDLN